MRSLKTAVKHFSDQLSLPPQLRPGVPTVELTGRQTAVIVGHRGLTEFTDRRICAASKDGRIAVTGEHLNITQMNSETLTVSGQISGVSFTGEK